MPEAIPLMQTTQIPGTNVLTISVHNPTDEEVPFTYEVDGEPQTITAKPKSSAEVSWTWLRSHTVRYGIFMPSKPEWSVPWQEFQFEPAEKPVENRFPSIKISAAE